MASATRLPAGSSWTPGRATAPTTSTTSTAGSGAVDGGGAGTGIETVPAIGRISAGSGPAGERRAHQPPTAAATTPSTPRTTAATDTPRRSARAPGDSEDRIGGLRPP